MFKVLKKRFTIEPILVVPDLDYTIESVFSMECNDEQWRPVTYLSNLLNKTEKL